MTFATVESNVLLADELYDTTPFHIGLAGISECHSDHIPNS